MDTGTLENKHTSGGTITWASLTPYIISALLMLVAFVGNGIHSDLSAIGTRVGNLETQVGIANTSGLNRDAEMLELRKDTNELLRWRATIEGEELQKERFMNRNQRQRISQQETQIKQGRFALRHEEEHERHVANVLTETIKNTPKVVTVAGPPTHPMTVEEVEAQNKYGKPLNPTLPAWEPDTGANNPNANNPNVNPAGASVTGIGSVGATAPSAGSVGIH